MKQLLYEESGDNYQIKDPFKLLALKAAKTTAKNLNRFKKLGLTISEISQSRGESAYRIQISSKKPLDFQLAHVEEGIGTKNVIADELFQTYGPTVYESVAIDNVASVMNDLSTTSASPLSFMLHVAAYPTEWFSNIPVVKALIGGTVTGCNLSGASWGGGESPTMRDIIAPGKSLLSGSAIGIINPSEKALSEEKLKSGDRIILLESSGVHCNGITMLRKELVKRLPHGYGTKLSDGTSYGQSLLTPAIIYSRLIEHLVAETEIHYAVHITGHGWRKLMRSSRNFTYTIETVPEPQPIFKLIQEYSKVSTYEMYNSYNMGAGFAVFVPEKSVKKVLEICKKEKIKAWNAGFIKRGERKIVIKPLVLTFDSNELLIRESKDHLSKYNKY